MGSVRGGLVLALLPASARAQACSSERPDWDGIPVTALGEAINLLLSPAGLMLLFVSLLAMRFRNQWIGLVAIVLWTGFISIVTMLDPTGLRAPAMAEGCIGSSTLFIVVAAAICVGIVFITKPQSSGTDPSET